MASLPLTSRHRPRIPGLSGQRRARPALTGRALALGALSVALVIALAAPVTRYLDSRTAVGQASSQLHRDEVARAQLRTQKARYADPGYIQAQARKRLQFAMPGDTVYTVVGAGSRSRLAARSGPATSHPATGVPWTTRLWGSVRAADRE